MYYFTNFGDLCDSGSFHLYGFPGSTTHYDKKIILLLLTSFISEIKLFLFFLFLFLLCYTVSVMLYIGRHNNYLCCILVVMSLWLCIWNNLQHGIEMMLDIDHDLFETWKVSESLKIFPTPSNFNEAFRSHFTACVSAGVGSRPPPPTWKLKEITCGVFFILMVGIVFSLWGRFSSWGIFFSRWRAFLGLAPLPPLNYKKIWERPCWTAQFISTNLYQPPVSHAFWQFAEPVPRNQTNYIITCAFGFSSSFLHRSSGMS